MTYVLAEAVKNIKTATVRLNKSEKERLAYSVANLFSVINIKITWRNMYD